MKTGTCLGDGRFSVAGLCLWNTLRVTLCDRDISLVQFKRLLEILLFVRAAAHSDCCFFMPCTNILTYLLTLTYLHRKFKASSFSCSRHEGPRNVKTVM